MLFLLHCPFPVTLWCVVVVSIVYLYKLCFSLSLSLSPPLSLFLPLYLFFSLPCVCPWIHTIIIQVVFKLYIRNVFTWPKSPPPMHDPLCVFSLCACTVQWQWIIIKQFLILGKLMKNEHNMNKCMSQAYLLLLLLLPQYALASCSFFFKVFYVRERERDMCCYITFTMSPPGGMFIYFIAVDPIP